MKRGNTQAIITLRDCSLGDCKLADFLLNAHNGSLGGLGEKDREVERREESNKIFDSEEFR